MRLEMDELSFPACSDVKSERGSSRSVHVLSSSDGLYKAALESVAATRSAVES